MKITIELTPEQVKGIKAYLSSVTHDEYPPTNEDVKEEIKSIVWSGLQSGAISDYLQIK